MDNNGHNEQQWTTMDNSGQQWITMDNNGQQWTTMDNNEQQWTTMDNNGQQWLTMDNTGQQWIKMDENILSATCISDAVFHTYWKSRRVGPNRSWFGHFRVISCPGLMSLMACNYLFSLLFNLK